MSITPVERTSYANRRQIFKDIWNATMLFDDGYATDVKVKPKVIKTLRLETSSHDKESVTKKRLKNLRTVCNKILAFCDYQEQDDLYNNQIHSSCTSTEKTQQRKPSKTKKKKIKMKKVKKSLHSSKDNALAKATDSERKDRNMGVPVPVDRARKRVKRAVPMVKAAVPMVSSQITSKLTSTRSSLRHTSSPSPVKLQKIIKKKSSTKK